MEVTLKTLLFVTLLMIGFIMESSAQPTVPNTSGVKRPQYKISVTQSGKHLGDIVIELFPDIAPKHAHNFDSLVSAGFYNGTAFHRVIPNFMIQGGDPNTKDDSKINLWGTGDPSQTRVPAEFSKLPHKRGIISAARTNDPNSATSQFFLCVADSPWLDNQYSIYGQVLSGMEVADMIVNTPRNSQDRPNEKVSMTIEKINVAGSAAKQKAKPATKTIKGDK